jgi:pimeloyl-ACP methyl ester carboxylesterase
MRCRDSALAVAATLLASCAGPLSGRTPTIKTASGVDPDLRIARLAHVPLGGAKQAVLVRGLDRTRPIVLVLHGGPGMPAMYLGHAFQRRMEREFVIVHWDRRGAGKSYKARMPVESLTVRRSLDDLWELQQWLREHVGSNRIILVGHSWGSYLGFQAVHERPTAFAAYMATGVISPDSVLRRDAQRHCVAEKATAAGDTALARRLMATPRDSTVRVTEGMLFRLGGELHRSRSVWKIIRTGLRAPEYTSIDAYRLQKGAQFVSRSMRDNVDASWMLSRPSFQIPIVFALGRHDCNTPTTAAAEFLDQLVAPAKCAVWFEHSAHFPFWEEPDRFLEVLRHADSASRGWSIGLPVGGGPRTPRSLLAGRPRARSS